LTSFELPIPGGGLSGWRYVRRKRIFYIIAGAWIALSLMWFTIDMLDGSD
jgi:hypothetical protein